MTQVYLEPASRGGASGDWDPVVVRWQHVPRVGDLVEVPWRKDVQRVVSSVIWWQGPGEVEASVNVRLG